MICANCGHVGTVKRPCFECDKCHLNFCRDCIQVVRQVDSELVERVYHACFKCDGVVGAAGHQRALRRQGVANEH